MNMSQNFVLSRWLRSASGQILLMVLLISAVYLITEHTAHVLNALPYVLLLACPLLHLFMHGGHGDHTGDSPKSQRNSESDTGHNV
jgi:hypothetical protein